jgi:hypothetical protein
LILIGWNELGEGKGLRNKEEMIYLTPQNQQFSTKNRPNLGLNT